MRDRWLTALKTVYMFGLGLAVIFALTGSPSFPRFRGAAGDLLGYLMYYGIAHMILLVFIAFKVSAPNKPSAGAKIQTAGYLHTLIGFVAALLALNATDAKLNTLLGLLGNALFTSIIGWAVGSEIAERGAPSSRHDFLDAKMDAVAREFEGFAEGVRSVNAEYLRSLRAVIAELKKETETLKDAKTVTDELSKKLLPVAELSGTLLKNLRELAAKSSEARDGLGEIAPAARDTAKYLKESRVLIVELERLLDFVRSRPGGTRYGG